MGVEHQPDKMLCSTLDLPPCGSSGKYCKVLYGIPTNNVIILVVTRILGGG